MGGTKISFMRDILSEAKLHLKQSEVIVLEIPTYQELSVKNLYDDAMADPVLQMYLPTKEQLSNKLPERDFFFGVMCTLKQQYMKDIVSDAQANRYKIAPDDPKKQGIIISNSWMKELMQHPYYSSKLYYLTPIEKPGTGIFLMKEHAKLYKVRTSTTKHSLSKRLSSESSV